MVEVIGDIVQPSEFISPSSDGTAVNQPTLSGAVFMSGANLCFYNGTKTVYVVLSGAAFSGTL